LVKTLNQDNSDILGYSAATLLLAKINFGVIVSSITSIEGYNYAALFVDDCTGFLWLYGMKT
jgi:hypothetical protein